MELMLSKEVDHRCTWKVGSYLLPDVLACEMGSLVQTRSACGLKKQALFLCYNSSGCCVTHVETLWFFSRGVAAVMTPAHGKLRQPQPALLGVKAPVLLEARGLGSHKECVKGEESLPL